MAFNIKDGSTWRSAKNVSVKDGSTWRTARGVWVNSSGTWRNAFIFSGSMQSASGSGGYGYFQALSVGSLSPVSFGGSASRFITMLGYEFLSSGKTSFIVDGNVSGITQTNFIKDIYVVGGSVLATADCSAFSLSTVAEWTWNGDGLGLQAAAGGPAFQVQARAA